MRKKIVSAENLQPGDIVETLDSRAVMVTDVQVKTIFAPMGLYPSVEVTLSNGIVFGTYLWMQVPVLP